MEIDKVAERGRINARPLLRGLAAVDPTLGCDGPPFRIGVTPDI